MRSVFVHLWHTTEEDVVAALKQCYAPNGPAGWMLEQDGDLYLYIDIYRDGAVEDEAWFTRFAARGGPPAVSVSADISGRHDGWPESQAFVAGILAKFDGVATDDGWLRFWSAAEVKTDARVEGRLFGYWRK